MAISKKVAFGNPRKFNIVSAAVFGKFTDESGNAPRFEALRGNLNQFDAICWTSSLAGRSRTTLK